MQELDALSSPSAINQTQNLIAEVYKAFGLSRQAWYHHLLDPVFQSPARRLAEITTSFDNMVERQGLLEAARWLLPNFITGLQVRGLESIPLEGPLLIAANHPGAADSICHAASIPRSDLKVISSDVPYLRGLPGLAKYMIPVSGDPFVRMGAVRAGLHHLQNGGALLLFSTGKIDPDLSIHAAALAQAELAGWSNSLDIFLRRTPNLQVVLAITSGVMARQCWQNPLKYLRKTPLGRRRIAEFLQVMLQMGWGWKFDLQARISYIRQFGIDLSGNGRIVDELKRRANFLLTDHLAALDGQVLESFQPVPIQD